MLSLNKFINKLVKGKNDTKGRGPQAPVIVPRSEHTISRKQISQNALNVLYTLKDAGYEAYLVGGCVRDLLLGHEPKDFDVATNALPEQVHSLFRRSRLIGRRFKLVHVRFGRDVIEVATFRAPPEASNHVDEQGRIMQDNVYGTLEQDAWRRDFTINALYYNIRDFSIVDYTGGIDDLNAGLIRLIGDVETRYREDPVRMLRAIRFVGKLGLKLDKQTEEGIFKWAALLADIPPARLFDETLKLYLTGNAAVTHELLCHYGLFDEMYPQTAALLHEEKDGYPRTLLMKALENTDRRIDDDRPVTPAFLFAALLWEPVRQRAQLLMENGMPEIPATQRASSEVIMDQVQRVAVPKRFSLVTKDIWNMQPRLMKRQGKRAFRALLHPKFRAAYDFLVLRHEAGEPLSEIVDWWTRFQEVSANEQEKMVAGLSGNGKTTSKPRRRRRRRKPATKKAERDD
ncbi:polynucleotide adenylyltransferase PcnB [Methylophaga sp. OBS1]|uniref:polynucleotide adenylyltransferase PcnB n=1 Tax=Methylophaga sp. OBS1 TaxID=2991933 RepID=UPI002255FF71|nr:polynucleotide adenylyltransferase PcnB [Methylophaga sp. OBS1]MCX4194060.1 polynucleotide adenylyltransferase PcnB [Methylophaga sp. OBS1]